MTTETFPWKPMPLAGFRTHPGYSCQVWCPSVRKQRRRCGTNKYQTNSNYSMISFMAIEDGRGHQMFNLCSDPTPFCLTAAQLSIACSCREPIGIQQAGFLLNPNWFPATAGNIQLGSCQTERGEVRA